MFLVTSRGFSVVAALLIVLMMDAGPVWAQNKSVAEDPAVDLQWAVKIPMRDRVKLNATVFTPILE